MTEDLEEQEDELLALQSIFDADEFVRDESKSAGEIRVCVELPAGFSVALREGESLRQYDISFLPPLLLNFGLPGDYPSSSPPSFSLTCSWLTRTQVQSLVGEKLFSRYDRLLLQNTLDSMSDVTYCPRTSCGSAVILEKSSKAVLCSECGFAFCVTCKRTYHGLEECETKKKHARDALQTILKSLDLPQSQEGVSALLNDYKHGSKERKRLLVSRYGNMLVTLENNLNDTWLANNSRCCPHCFSRIEKNGGCDHMLCSQCGQDFNWCCAFRLTTENGKTHLQEYICENHRK
uniref:RBR-type E3 ubiquitin transferase n=1 Tax=Oreochromis aureus TaxID=47969 RepID=A0AAZ1XF60_OREAU